MPNLTQQKEYYDSRWATEGVNRLRIARCAAILAELACLPVSQPRIIDFGCGTGWLTSVLSNFGPAEGVDLAASGAMARYPHLRFHQADLNVWRPVIQPFDVLVSQEVIEHFEVHRNFVDTAAALVKKDGWLIMTTPNRRTTDACTPEWRSEWLCQPIENLLSARELRALLTPRFSVVRCTSFLLGYGSSGTYRVANSIKLRRILDGLGLKSLWDQMLNERGYGLHLLVTARRT